MATPEEIQKITELHDKGYTQGQIAKELNRSKSYINGIFQKLGLSVGVLERSQTKNASIAHKNYAKEDRIKLSNKFLCIIEERLLDKEKLTNNDIKSLATSYAIMVDKRQILEPDVIAKEKSGLDEIREALKNGMEANPSKL